MLSAADERPVIFIPEPLHPQATRHIQAFARVHKTVRGCSEAKYAVIRNFRLTTEVLQKMPRLQLVVKHGAGVDNINPGRLDSLGVSWTSTPGFNANGVAELAVSHALQLLRSTDKKNDDYPMRELAEQKVSVIGLGRIGGRIARIISAGFGAQVFAYDPLSKEIPQGVTLLESAIELVKDAGVLFIACPHTPETEGLVNTNLIRELADGAVIINTSRPPIVDNSAIGAALSEQKIHGYAHDFRGELGAFDCSPKRGMVVATPHLGGSTEEALLRTGLEVARVLEKRVQSAEN